MNPTPANDSVIVRPKPPERVAPKSILDGGKLPESMEVTHLIFKNIQKIPGDHNCQSWRASDRGSTGAYKFTYIVRAQFLEGIWTPSDAKKPIERFFVPMWNVEHWQ